MTIQGDNHPTGEPGEPTATTHADPLDGTDSLLGDPLAEDAGLATAAPAASKVFAATLASVVGALVGVAVWAFVHVQLEREYVGVSVIIGLVVGWLMRVLSGRSTLPIRLVAVVVTALSCVAGTLVSRAAFDDTLVDDTLMERLGNLLPHTGTIMSELRGLTYAIFVAALVLAFLSASPQKEKTKKGAAAPVEPAPLGDGGADDYYAADDEYAAGDQDDEEQPPPPASQLPPG